MYIKIGESAPEIRFVAIFQSFVIVVLLSLLYYWISRYLVSFKINRLFCRNEYEKCSEYIDKCLQTHKKAFYLKFKKITLLFLTLNYSEFENYASVLKLDKKAEKKKYKDSLENFENILELFCKGNTKEGYAVFETGNMSEKLLYLVYNRNNLSPEKAELIALEIYNSPCNLFKSFSAAFLAKVYKEKNNLYISELYSNKAKEFAVTEDSLKQIEALIN